MIFKYLFQVHSNTSGLCKFDIVNDHLKLRHLQEYNTEVRCTLFSFSEFRGSTIERTILFLFLTNMLRVLKGMIRSSGMVFGIPLLLVVNSWPLKSMTVNGSVVPNISFLHSGGVMQSSTIKVSWYLSRRTYFPTVKVSGIQSIFLEYCLCLVYYFPNWYIFCPALQQYDAGSSSSEHLCLCRRSLK